MELWETWNCFLGDNDTPGAHNWDLNIKKIFSSYVELEKKQLTRNTNKTKAKAEISKPLTIKIPMKVNGNCLSAPYSPMGTSTRKHGLEVS